jgi:hypothetical protein
LWIETLESLTELQSQRVNGPPIKSRKWKNIKAAA